MRIEGIRILKPIIHTTMDGNFSEISRFEGMEKLQVNLSVLSGKSIKAWHFHNFQTDYFFPLERLIIGLWDKREDSSTYGELDLIALDREIINIPPGVAHGVMNPSYNDRSLLYFVDQYYNPDDEGRLPWDALGKEFWEVTPN